LYEPKLLKTREDLAACESEIERLTLLAPDTFVAERIALLRKLVALYDAEVLAAQAGTALEAIRIRMVQRGWRQKDLAVLLGGRNRASEVLSGKRPLTARMIAALSVELNIPPALLFEAAARQRRRRNVGDVAQ
jgi:HTH-type transcriptional regulator / antitoxin HigA